MFRPSQCGTTSGCLLRVRARRRSVRSAPNGGSGGPHRAWARSRTRRDTRSSNRSRVRDRSVSCEELLRECMAGFRRVGVREGFHDGTFLLPFRGASERTVRVPVARLRVNSQARKIALHCHCRVTGVTFLPAVKQRGASSLSRGETLSNKSTDIASSRSSIVLVEGSLPSGVAGAKFTRGRARQRNGRPPLRSASAHIAPRPDRRCAWT